MPDIAAHPADLVYGRGLIAAESIAQELRERLARELSRRRRELSELELLDLAREILAQFEPILAENFANTDLAAWIAGVEAVTKKLSPSVLNSFALLAGGGGEQPPPRFRFPLVAPDGGGVVRAAMPRGGRLASAGARVRVGFILDVLFCTMSAASLICESKAEFTQHVIFAMLVLGGVQGDCQCAAHRFVFVFRSARRILLFNGKP
jgi:hypothetical protein